MFDFADLGDAEEEEESAEAVAAVAAVEAVAAEAARRPAEASPEAAAAGSAGSAAAEAEDRPRERRPDEEVGLGASSTPSGAAGAPAAEPARPVSLARAGAREEAPLAAAEPAAAAAADGPTPSEPSRPAQAVSPAPASPQRVVAAVGEHFVSVARVLMRTGESLKSDQVGFLPANRLLEIEEVGQGRRVRVLEETGVEGWVSLAKETGEVLLERKGVNARQTFNFRRLKEDREAAARAPPPPPAPVAAGATSSSSPVKCDKCDGPHPTDACPFFKKAREDHKDAWANYGQKNPLKMGTDGGNFTLRGAKVIRQPGDGSCLFHSLSFGLNNGRPNPNAAEALRRELVAYIERNPQKEIGGDTIEEWVRWDANSSVSAYAAQMGRRGWGGGVEMAVCSILKAVNVHVYEAANGGNFKRISCFDAPGSSRTVHVLYQGRCHYDALVPAN